MEDLLKEESQAIDFTEKIERLEAIIASKGESLIEMG